MSTTDNLTLLTLTDIIVRQIANNRMGVYRLMAAKPDPFPKPIVLFEGKRQAKVKRNRFSGRRVAWRAVDVEAWLDRRAARSREDAA